MVVAAGVTITVVLPVPNGVPTPHPAVYQLIVVPLPPFAVRIAEFPMQSEFEGAVTETGATGML